ncbi:uracil-DNA glycosylase [Candidatus Pelagibacter communis]|uniref:uracil-DNA glycosylase n=1 Tax=Pelagibacter ubique TaxID=198252 RepID=UPI00094C7F83|nr:uracil-DNA glycosylase [Candidatus Pelagibacter ubique]|tara:strand:+ start:2633 stop:3328 length:696 start_codon:yes stop_codon:yes gene_type:complete
MTYKKELINSIEPNFIFSEKPINRFQLNEIKKDEASSNKIQQIENLIKSINSIKNCNLKNQAKKLIFGEGNINSPIMIVGEAPVLEDDINGKVYQGESGILLEKMLLAINLTKTNIYSTYAVNFRPPEDRKPTSEEIKRYSVFLKEHISIIDPKVIILFGSTAMESLIASKQKISIERGKWKEIILKNKTYPVIITFSPSYLIRFPENKRYSWEDLKKIKKKILDLKIEIS